MELFYVDFLTVRLFIQLETIVIFQFTLPTLSHQVPSSFILNLKRLHLNLLNIVTLLTLKVVLGDNHTRLTTILTIFKSKLSRSTLTDTRILLSQLFVYIQNNISLGLYISVFGHVSIARLKQMARKVLLEGLPTNIHNLQEPWPICILTNENKIPRG